MTRVVVHAMIKTTVHKHLNKTQFKVQTSENPNILQKGKKSLREVKSQKHMTQSVNLYVQVKSSFTILKRLIKLARKKPADKSR